MSFPAIDDTHDATRTSWVACANGHVEFPIQNLPLGIFAPGGGEPRAGTAIGTKILDLRALAQVGLLPTPAAAALAGTSLNALFALPARDRVILRGALSTLLSDASQSPQLTPHLHAASDCPMYLPAAIGDYTDFYVGIHHATNIGKLFRPDNPLLPNYKHVPIGYHGRASSIQPSGVPVTRPTGQRKSPDGDFPIYGPSIRLDYELELGVWIGEGNALGASIPIDRAAEHIAGFCLLNDWSARDFQAWEYVPLGPFLAKSFQSTISPWVITAEAMAPFRRAQPERPAGDPKPLPHLWDADDQAKGALAVTLEVAIATARMRASGLPSYGLSRGPASNMYWTVEQIVTHHASNGCNLRPGDLLGTGTISTPTPDGYGSLIELTSGGTVKIALPNGEHRSFLEDGDEITLSARAHAEGYVSIGFGECRAIIEPAR
ncbi:fumarylacetoacetase [soil metagenome]